MATHRRSNRLNSPVLGDEHEKPGLLVNRFTAPKKTLKDRAKHYLPIIDWLGHYQIKRDLKFDIIAGITVAMMLIPQEVSLSTIMNVPAHHGLYTAATAPLVYALFGSSTVLSVASGSEVSLLVGTILEDIEDEDERIATGVLYAFLSGCILLTVRILNLSQIADFFSRPVMGGFVSAGGILIALAQVANWWGVKIDSSDYPPVNIYRLFSVIEDTNGNSFWVGTISIVFLFALRFFKKKFFPNSHGSTLFEPDKPEPKSEETEEILTPVRDPGVAPPNHSSHGFSLTDQQYISMETARATERARRGQEAPTNKLNPTSTPLRVLVFFLRTICDLGPLLVCIGGGLVGYALGPKRIKLTGDIPSGFPSPKWPWYGYNDDLIHDKFGSILVNALSIVVVVFLSSIAMAKRLAIYRGEDINTNQELTGLGVASIVCGFFQAMPPTGGMSRTAVNFQNAHTQLSSIITTLIIILSLYTLTGTLYYLPRATLASIIITAGISLVEFKEAKWLYKVRKDEFVVWVLSFVLTFCLGVLNGLIGSIIVSVLALMYKSKTSSVVILGELENGSLVDRIAYVEAKHLDHVVAVRVESSLFFANCERVAVYIDNEIARLLHEGIHVRGVVIDAQYMNDMDATTIQVLSDVQEKLEIRGITFSIANAKGKIHDLIASTNLIKRVLGNNPSIRLEDAVRILRELPTSLHTSEASSPVGVSAV